MSTPVPADVAVVLSSRIRMWRLDLRLDLKELAEQSEIPRKKIIAMERGNIDREVLERYIPFLGLSERDQRWVALMLDPVE